jgi:O-antigen/teichoic acid export membrane protein
VNLKKRVILPDSGKIKYWLKLITITGTAQIIVQAVGFLSGILVIHLLSVDEYALYTLANTMLGTMVVLSDGGISTGVMAQGGKVWQDRQKLGAVLATGLDLRRKFAIFSLVVSVPILGYLLLHHGATWVTTVLITASLIPAFYASLSDSLLQIPVKLHQAIVPLQRNQIEVGVGRLILSGITLFAFPWTFVAIIASGIPRIWGNVRLRKIVDGFVDKEQSQDVIVRKNILKGVKRLMPDSIYYCLSGQITIWLISVFGTTTSVGRLGALGRISAILSVLTIILHTLIVPRFARYNDNQNLLKYFTKTIAMIVLISIIIILLTYFFSDIILKILGNSYSTLHTELILSISVGCFSVLNGFLFGLVTAKGWPTHPIIIIGGNIIVMLIGIWIFDISGLIGILKFNIFLSFFPMIAHTVNFLLKIKENIKKTNNN